MKNPCHNDEEEINHLIQKILVENFFYFIYSIKKKTNLLKILLERSNDDQVNKPDISPGKVR